MVEKESNDMEAAYISNAPQHRLPAFCSLPPQRLSQKVSTPHPLIGSAAPRSKTLHHTEKSQKLGITRLRNPLEELKPSCGGANVGHVSHTQTGTCWKPGNSLLG